MIRAIVIAAGDGVRWGDYLGVPKHLVEIEGERLLDRTTRLLSPHAEVIVVGRDARYRTPASDLFIPRLTPTYYGADKFLSSRSLWNPDGRTLVVYGDVYFTEAAIATVLAYQGEDWRLFARFAWSSYYGVDSGECFVQSFWPRSHGDHLSALRRCVRARRDHILPEIGGWTHYRAMEGFFLTEHARGYRLIEINDATDDIDYPADYDRIVSHLPQLMAVPA